MTKEARGCAACFSAASSIESARYTSRNTVLTIPLAAGSASTAESKGRSPDRPCATGPPEAIARIGAVTLGRGRSPPSPSP